MDMMAARVARVRDVVSSLCSLFAEDVERHIRPFHKSVVDFLTAPSFTYEAQVQEATVSAPRAIADAAAAAETTNGTTWQQCITPCSGESSGSRG